MIVPLNVTHFFIRPHQIKTPILSKIALTIASLAIGILSFGLIHISFYLNSLCHKVKVIKKNEVHLNIDEIFKKEVLDNLTHPDNPKQLWDKLEILQTQSPCFQKEKLKLPMDRYSNVRVYKHNVLICNKEFTHASWIDLPGIERRFIATQAPIPSFFGHFFALIREQNIKDIVILANENNPNEKINLYWPKKKGDIVHGYKKLEEKIIYPGYLVHTLESIDTKQVLKLHQFTLWPDMGVVKAKQLKEFIQNVKKNWQDSHTPSLIHCSAGIGRTGTFLAAYYLLSENKFLNIAQVVALLRSQRMGMVQKYEQFQLLFEVLKEEKK